MRFSLLCCCGDVRIQRCVEPRSPADVAGVERGDRIINVDFYSLINEGSSAGLTVLNECLFQTQLGAAHNFELQAVDDTIKNEEHENGTGINCG